MFLTSTIKFSNKTSTTFRPPSDFSPYTNFDYSSPRLDLEQMANYWRE
jgi:hypothetical protein